MSRRKPLSQRSRKVLAAMYGQPSFWRDAVGGVLSEGEAGICYATYQVHLGQAAADDLFTLFLTDQRLYWCRLDWSGVFTGEYGDAAHADVVAIGPQIGDKRALHLIYASPDRGQERISARCRNAPDAIAVHRMMLLALDLTLGRPPYAWFRMDVEGVPTPQPPRKPLPPNL